MSSDDGQQDAAFGPSVLGTKRYWDRVYERDIENFKDHGDVGEVWFGEDCEEEMISWIGDHAASTDSTVLDLGCGNGHMLISLAARCSFTRLYGIDYSESAIHLARSIAQAQGGSSHNGPQFVVGDVLSRACDLPTGGGRPLADGWPTTFDFVVDKGTFDAVSLKPSDEGDQGEARKATREVDHGAIERYPRVVASLMDNHRVFLITSCSWTIEELKRHFAPGLEYCGEIKRPRFTFGGRSGQTVVTAAFKKV